MGLDKDKKMAFFGGRTFIQLTDENPAANAKGRTLIINKNEIVAVYRREEDPNKSNVITSDNRSYVVSESVQTIAKMLG